MTDEELDYLTEHDKRELIQELCKDTALFSGELAECKAKLARVELVLDQYLEPHIRADDFGRLFRSIRAALKGTP